MRLLHTKKPGLEFEEFHGEDVPSYVILSHTWYSQKEEVSYQDVCNGRGQSSPGYDKILKCKLLASEYDYFWVDTCCIDKTSSAELSEAINSMYSWYSKAAVCYAYLSDVSYQDSIESFKESRWFTRGWTLQELIAPAIVVFYSKEWERLSEKHDLVDTMNEITGIPEKVLSGHAELVEFSVAERMSWASNRTTTRIEDEAYCLMGIFNVNMPLMYGEKQKAFQRLQEEIMKITDDQSLFAWADPDIKEHRLTGLLATRPKAFAESKNINSMGIWGRGNVLGTTNRGIRVKLYLIPSDGDDPRNFVASLDCWTDAVREYTVVLFLRRLGTNGTGYASAHETQFARMHILGGLGFGSRSDKGGGKYREICVRDMALSHYELNLGAYDYFGKHIRIQDPGRPFSVHPARCWEPQSGIFSAVHSYSGTLGAICVPSDDCSYIMYFGRDKKADFWVKTELREYRIESAKDDIWNSYDSTDEEISESEALHSCARPPNLYTERFIGEIKPTALYDVMIYEISFAVTRKVFEQINMDGKTEIESQSTDNT